MRHDFVVKSAFYCKVFGHCLDDPVAILDLCEIFIEVARGDKPGGFGNEESSWAASQCGFHAGTGCLIAEYLTREDNIEQQRRNLRVSEMRGDAGTHGSR